MTTTGDPRYARFQLALRAPAIPDWFAPVMPPRPAPPQRPDKSRLYDEGGAFADLEGFPEGDRVIRQFLQTIEQLNANDHTAVELIEAGQQALITLAQGFCRIHPERELSDDQLDQVRDWMAQWGAYQAALITHAAASRAWVAESDRQQLAQWPWAYADLVLAAHRPQDVDAAPRMRELLTEICDYFSHDGDEIHAIEQARILLAQLDGDAARIAHLFALHREADPHCSCNDCQDYASRTVEDERGERLKMEGEQ